MLTNYSPDKREAFVKKKGKVARRNEFNITTHHLFIDFKASYDTIIRNEELNFPTKLIRLTKTTLSIVMCCVKIQNDCSESFETRQGLRQGDVISMLLFEPTNNRHNIKHRNTTTRICR
jgi:hypothetical protein